MTLLNDQTQAEFSLALARVTLTQGGRTQSKRIRYAFERCLARVPEPAEEARLQAFLERMLDDFALTPQELTKSSSKPPAVTM